MKCEIKPRFPTESPVCILWGVLGRGSAFCIYATLLVETQPLLAEWSCMGSSGSRECDTGCGGKVGGPRLTIWHCGLTVVDTASISPPIIYACINCIFTYGRADVLQGGGC